MRNEGFAGEWWRELAQEQAGVIARRQLIAGGLTPSQAGQRIETGHWVRVLPGVYATFTGELSHQARVWAALLHAGHGATASHQTALWLATAIDEAPHPVHVTVPSDRRVRVPQWIRVHRRRDLEAVRHPNLLPPRVRLDIAVLDCCNSFASVNEVLDLVLRVTQRRLTNAARLRSALAARGRHHWRALLGEILAEVDDGVASSLELRHARDVERAHGLPRGERNRAESAPGGGTWYRDVRYREWSIVVELDGRQAHPAEGRFRDMRRDNHAAVQGEQGLRYGWHDVAGRPCAVAAQLATILQTRGWPGTPTPCSPSCRVTG